MMQVAGGTRALRIRRYIRANLLLAARSDSKLLNPKIKSFAKFLAE